MSAPLSGRRVAREAALLVLFAIDAGRLDDADTALAAFSETLCDDPEVLNELARDDDDAAPNPRVRDGLRRVLSRDGAYWPFARRLVDGVVHNQVAIDDLVGRCSLNWKVARMSKVDRNILRLAAYELAFENVPGRATLNEAIELAKRYGTEESGKFVNGILDRIAKELEQV